MSILFKIVTTTFWTLICEKENEREGDNLALCGRRGNAESEVQKNTSAAGGLSFHIIWAIFEE